MALKKLIELESGVAVNFHHFKTNINRPKIRNLRTNAKDGKYSVFKVQVQVKLANSTDKK